MELIIVVLRQVNRIIQHSEQNASEDPRLVDFSNLLRDAVKKLLPSLTTVFQCWQRVTSSSDSSKDIEDEEVDEVDVREDIGSLLFNFFVSIVNTSIKFQFIYGFSKV